MRTPAQIIFTKLYHIAINNKDGVTPLVKALKSIAPNGSDSHLVSLMIENMRSIYKNINEPCPQHFEAMNSAVFRYRLFHIAIQPTSK